MFSITAGLVAALLATANAHMFLQSPTPIEGNAVKDPLPSDGPGFPCHGSPIPTSGGQEMAAGSSQRLSFDLGGGYNTAVHGGGSCQISISYETDATALANPDNWKVIHSIEGGCPSNTVGNLDGSYEGPQGSYTGAIACSDPRSNGVDCVNEFNFTIPNGVKSGHAIMAWTWFNTIGNREIYMNCINTQITGGDGSEMDEFPSMFVANTEINQCRTDENFNTKFQYPGKYLTTHQPTNPSAKKYDIAPPTGGSCAGLGAPASGNAGTPPAYGGSQPSAAPSSAAASAPVSSAPASGYASPPASSAPPSNGAPSSVAASGGLVTVTTMQTVTSGAASASASAPAYSAPAPSGNAPAPSGSAPAAPSSYAPAPSGSSSSTGHGSCPAGSVSCSNPGAVVCGSSTQFGLCDINNCAVMQAVASGTHCQGGKVLKRDHVRRHLGKHVRREF